MYKDIENLTIAPNGKSFAFAAQKKNGKWVIVKD